MVTILRVKCSIIHLKHRALCLVSAWSQYWLCLGSILALSWLCLVSAFSSQPRLCFVSAWSQPCLSLVFVLSLSCLCIVSDLSPPCLSAARAHLLPPKTLLFVPQRQRLFTDTPMTGPCHHTHMFCRCIVLFLGLCWAPSLPVFVLLLFSSTVSS